MAKPKTPTKDCTTDELIVDVRLHAKELAAKEGARSIWHEIPSWDDQKIVQTINGTKKQNSARWYCKKRIELELAQAS